MTIAGRDNEAEPPGKLARDYVVHLQLLDVPCLVNQLDYDWQERL